MTDQDHQADAAGGGYRFDTLAVHAGGPTFTLGGAHPMVTPIVHASSFWYDSSDDLDRVLGGEQPGYVYGRYASPTVDAFEEAVAALERAPGAVAYASGMAALHAALLACAPRPGTGVFASQDCYGGTHALLTDVVMASGVKVEFVDIFDHEWLATRLAAERPRALLVETISNPLQRVADVAALARLAHDYGAQLIVDSTFTTPYLLQPLALGATFVVHSATKYLGGHGDVTGGVVACASPDLVADLRTLGKLTGAVLGPQEAYLALRGVKTLSLRMARQCSNAVAVARALAEHPRVERVHFPGLGEGRQRAVAERQFPPGLYGAMLAFEIAGADQAAVMRFMERLRLVRPAPTLGDCYSLVLYPVIASHRALTPEQRAARGIRDNLVRFSAGIEDPADLIADLTQALG